jgi:NAD(P)-dependent dehydrogenase (short-subunit alcohol dehydrogenase family)
MLIGATGTIGRAVSAALASRDEVNEVTRHSQPFRVDISSPESIRALFQAVGELDGVVCATGSARFKPLAQLEDGDFEVSAGQQADGAGERCA